MNLANNFLDQARLLATVDPRRPKQANLRRAASAAYYALFHLLTGEVAGLFASEVGLIARICRTINHTDMKRVSTQVLNNRLPRSVQAPGGSLTPADLRIVAEAFIRLQDVRHEADYDRQRVFRRDEVQQLLRVARNAFDAWNRVRRTDDARLYLACFLLWERWDRDPR